MAAHDMPAAEGVVDEADPPSSPNPDDARAKAWSQAAYDVRFDWGPEGIATTEGADVVVVVDVLSFGTAVSIAVEQGATVFPYPWKDDGAAAFAHERGAHLAVGRDETTAERPFSLAPGSLRGLGAGERLVLPSGNGAMVTLAVAERTDAVILAGCLRNARAVAHAARMLGGRIAVLAAGERWPGGVLRPALEDAFGAAAILRPLSDRHRSPEAEACARMLPDGDLTEPLLTTATGRELVGWGFPNDVRVAAALDEVSTLVPRFVEGAFEPWSPARRPE